MAPLLPPPHLLETLSKELLEEIELALSDPDAIRFRVETNPRGPAIDLVWELPDPALPADAVRLRVLRRVRRFPGRGRRGIVPVTASPDDLADGTPVHDSSTFEWDVEETRDEVRPDGLVSTTRQFLYRGSPRDRVLVRTIRREYAPDGTPSRTTIRATDRDGLEAGTIYYYTAFVGSGARFSRRTQSSALATGPGGLELFPLLPRIDRQRDTEIPQPFTVPNSEQDRGQLERLLRAVEAHGDMLLGFVDGLRDLHDARRADARLLEPMAELIGWQLKDYLDEDGQRNEITFAPDVYRTLGTAPNVAAMVNRLTGWTADVKDFARSVVLSWDGTRVEQLDAGPAYLDGSAHVEGDPPVLVTRTVPAGSVDTSDAGAMFQLRNKTFEDQTAYTYDCGRPDTTNGGYVRDDDTWYNRETIGVYATPDVETEPFVLQQTWERVREILSDFLPLQARAVLFLRPGVVVETPYVATTEVQESVVTVGLLLHDEDYAAAADDALTTIPEWRWLITNETASRSVDTAAPDLSHRSWEGEVQPGP